MRAREHARAAGNLSIKESRLCVSTLHERLDGLNVIVQIEGSESYILLRLLSDALLMFERLEHGPTPRCDERPLFARLNLHLEIEPLTSKLGADDRDGQGEE